MPLLSVEDNDRMVKEWRALKHKLVEADKDLMVKEEKQKEIRPLSYNP